MSDLFRYIFQDAYLAKFMLPDAARERLDRLDPRWWVASAQLIAFLGGVALLSPLFDPVPNTLQPFGWLIGLLMAAGIVFLGVGELLRFFPPRRSLMLLILATGLAMRLIMSWAPPVLEVDYQRYLWDGAVIASGENPYRLPPADIAGQPDPRLQALYRQSQGLPDRINHGHLTTVYPPLTQAFFALAYQIRPFSPGAWKAILYLADLITLLLIFAILKRLGRSPTWAALYWLNPLLIKEMFNSAHMDLLVFPFLMAAILWAISDRHLLAMVFLSAATAVKLWPVILAPIFLKMLWPRWRQLLTATVVFGLLTLALLAPMLLTGIGSGSGLATYGETWHNNDSLHKLLRWGYEHYLTFRDIHPGHARAKARTALLVLMGIWVVIQTFQFSGRKEELADRLLLVSAALFLLSPTQFPWYACWLAPLLALQPRRPLLAISALLPLYYLRFYFEGRGETDFFENWLVWLEFAPVWLWILRDYWQRKRYNRPYSTEVAVGYEIQ